MSKRERRFARGSGCPTASNFITEDYRAAFEGNGFDVVAQTDRRDFALGFLKRMTLAADSADGPAPLGLLVLMQRSSAEKIPNMVENLAANRISPIEMIDVKRG